MNNVQRRLFRRYVEGGGDLVSARDVDSMFRSVQTTMVLMPPRVRAAMELALNAPEDTSYKELAEALATQSGEHVTVSAFRQRVSRGMRDLERAIFGGDKAEHSRDGGRPRDRA
jgi:DNA-directed RNA polymerase specialized sigma24 family protein